jgi:HSP90 family molecular chaperone
MHKDMLKDLLLFKTSVANENKKVSYVSLKEYVERMKDGQSAIYYAPGESVEKIEMLPQIASLKKLGYEVLYLTDDVDEFALKVLEKYDEKPFKNITSEELDITTDEEKAKVKSENENAEEMFKFMKEQIGETFTSYLEKLRIDKAKEYLTQTNYSNEQIASLTGFTTTTTFYRAFQRRNKVSPGVYRSSRK